MQFPLRRADGLRLEVLRPQHAQAAHAVISEAFTDEPGSVAIQPDKAVRKQEWSDFCRMFQDDCAGNGLSIVCLDSTQRDAVVGAFWVRDFKAPLPEDFENVVAKLTRAVGPMVDVLVELDEKFESGRPEIKLGDAADLWMVGVLPSHCKRGIARWLTATALQHAHAEGFPFVFLEATGGFSARCASAAGMQEAVNVQYATAERPQFQSLDNTEHSHMRFFSHEQTAGVQVSQRHQMQFPLQRADGLRLEVLRPQHAQAAHAVISEAFTDEPGSVAIQPDKAVRRQEWSDFCRMFQDDCAGNGLSIVCLDSTQRDAVVGAFWVRDFKAPLPEDFENVVAKLTRAVGPMVDVLVELDEKFESGRPEIKLGNAADLWMVGVLPSHCKRGIARWLTATALQHAHAEGFPFVFLEATGGFSARCASAAGMQEAVNVQYATAERPQFQSLDNTEHSHMRFFSHEQTAGVQVPQS